MICRNCADVDALLDVVRQVEVRVVELVGARLLRGERQRKYQAPHREGDRGPTRGPKPHTPSFADAPIHRGIWQALQHGSCHVTFDSESQAEGRQAGITRGLATFVPVGRYTRPRAAHSEIMETLQRGGA